MHRPHETGGPGGHHKHHRRAAMSGRRHGHGPGGWGAPGDPRGWGGRRRRMRRGDVRAALLVLLDEQPHTGYSLIEEIERRSEGAWRPSPGSVYPTLQQLEDEGLVRPEGGEGRTPFTLTEEGRAYVAEHREQLGEPWAQPAGEAGKLNLRQEFAPLAIAAQQVAQAGTAEQIEQAKQILGDARKALYRLLAED
jgi:DNA-binding PadR family transcriptional regulator